MILERKSAFLPGVIEYYIVIVVLFLLLNVHWSVQWLLQLHSEILSLFFENLAEAAKVIFIKRTSSITSV